jgi:hypothetical protein
MPPLPTTSKRPVHFSSGIQISNPIVDFVSPITRQNGGSLRIVLTEPGGLKVPSVITAADSMVVSFNRIDVSLAQDGLLWAQTAAG